MEIILGTFVASVIICSTGVWAAVTLRRAWTSIGRERTTPNGRTIASWQRRIHVYAVDKGWWDDRHKWVVPVKVALMHSELSEALEAWRTKRCDAWVDNGKPEGFPVELADCVIRILDVCEYLGIDLETHMAAKHAFNKTRPHKHGGKAC